MKRLIPSFALFWILAGAAAAGEIRVQVKYRSSAAVYLAGGGAEGLAVGDHLLVVASGAAFAELEITYLAEHSASCKVIRESRPVRAGDVAVIKKEAAAPEITVMDTATQAAPATPLPAVVAASESIVPWARARGGASIGWYKLWDQTTSGFDFEQRTARLDLGLWDVGGRPFEINARARSRQDIRARPAGSFQAIPTDERLDRLYELSLRYDPPAGRLAFEVGRIGVSSLGVGYLDGGLLELRPTQPLRLGAFFGKRADVYQVPGYQSGDKYGGYLRLSAGGPSWPGTYDATVFGVREMAGSEVSREYVGFQGRFGARGFSFFQWAEVDLLRGWRQAEGGPSSQLSNLSLAANYRFAPSASFGVSYDQRRNYKTAETRSVPDALFDTFLHQGFRGSVDVSRRDGFGFTAFAGVRLQDQFSNTAYSYGGGLRHPSLLGTHLAASLDGSGFTNGTTSGAQGSFRLARNTTNLTLDVAYGLSSYTFKGASLAVGGSAAPPRRLNQWGRASARGELGHGLWLYGEFQYDHGDDAKGPRFSGELGYRF